LIRKREGFKGQKAIILPQAVLHELKANAITRLLFVTDIGFYPKAHYHYRERSSGSDQHILIYCTMGKGWVETDSGKLKVLKDQFFIIPAKKPHKYGADNRDPWTIYWVHFKGDLAGSFVNDEVSLISIGPAENMMRNDHRIRVFEELYQNLTMGYSNENLEYASICLWYLLGAFTYLPQFERIRAVQQHDIIEKSILYMHEHIESEINLSELSSFCGYSISHYSMVFKKKTSRSPMEYFNNLKIQRASQMLDFTNLQVNEIATQLHFDDPFYFSRVFKKTMGLSPSEYRKKKKG
jgi:AraC-like DNA-binding protein